MFLNSSPPTTDPPLVEETENAKMEEVMIPRSRKIGGKSGVMPHILAGKTLQTFLGPILSKTSKIKPIPAAGASLPAKEDADRAQLFPSSPMPSSLIGQPPSVLNVAEDDADQGKNKGRLNQEEKDLDAELKEFYEGSIEAAQNMILNEKIEEKESKLWEVPNLPPPNACPSSTDLNWLHVPKSFADFLIPPLTGDSTSGGARFSTKTKPPHQFLKKAKGRQSLGLALSWIPFTVDKKLPSVVELVGVQELFDDISHVDGAPADPVQVEKLFKILKIDIDPDDVTTHHTQKSEELVDAQRFGSAWREIEFYRPPEAYSFMSEGFQIVLNRQERRRLARVEGRVVEDEDDDEEENGGVNTVDDGVAVPAGPAPTAGDKEIDVGVRGNDIPSAGHQGYERPNKRRRLSLDDVKQVAPGASDVMVPRLGAARLRSHIPPPQDAVPFSEDEFAQLRQQQPLYPEGTFFSDDGFDYGHVGLSVPSAAPWIGSGSGSHPRGAYDEYDGVRNGDYDEDKENLPPPTSPYSSSVLLDDSERGMEGAGDDLGYGYGYQGQEQGWTGSVGYAHEYDHNQDYVMDVHPSYTTPLDAADQLVNMFEADQVPGGFRNDSLSFGSQYAFPGGQTPKVTLLTLSVCPNEKEYGHDQGPEQVKADNQKCEKNETPRTSVLVDKEDGAGPSLLSTAYEPKLASQSLGSFTFAHLRARKVSAPAPAVRSIPEPTPILPNLTLVDEERRPGLPSELVSKDTLVFSTTAFAPPGSIHRYMASLDLIQKHALVRELGSEESAVELVERYSLGGVDLILDPYCAVVFLSLFTLPARCEAYVDRVSKQSWIYNHLLVVFEAYPEQLSKRANANRVGGSTGGSSSSSSLYAYTPPIVKAIKKFRRDINIAEACGSKRAETKVQYAFADNVREAALFTRWFGDRAEERDGTGGMIWGERRWLGEDYSEDEEDCLADVQGLNHFSASIILSQLPLRDFLHLLPEERAGVCAGLLADEIIAACNTDIETRLRAMDSSSDDFS
ncbi:hypothetical protein CPB84DRAFT_1776215 [Gymnopilus junonius]|uniref:Uncharacterized protein n=1 Tax=Gymnopilus junonius TaxID=109634 RepID=A0A9P5TMX6_GYMJU|nr:hypothetical protein CPB84DRAFT_1776215 [Gymnopilus junonius]